MKTPLVLLGSLMAGALAPGFAVAAGCSDVPGMPAAASVAAAGAALWKERGDDLEPELLPADVAAIAALKVQLASIVEGVATCVGTKADANGFDAAVAKLGLPEPVKLEARSFQNGDRLGVVARFAIPCGEDAMLIVYERRERHWQPMLRWSAGPYSRIDKAWGSFQYDISADADGQWFVASAHVRPWCSSAWSVIDYAVARPGVAADRPRLVLEDQASLWFGGDDVGRLRIEGHEVEWRFRAASLDPGLHNREHVRRYAIDADRATRIAPVADSARDFVDEWIISPWSAARPWSDPERLAALEREHAEFVARRHSAFTFGATRRCAGDAVEVELRDEDGQAQYFRVDGVKAFTLRSIARKADPDCAAIVSPSTESEASQ